MVLEDLESFINSDVLLDLIGSPMKLSRTNENTGEITNINKQTGLMDSPHGEVVFPNQQEEKTKIQIVNSQPTSGKGVQYVYISSPTKQILPKSEPMVVHVSNSSPLKPTGLDQRLTAYSIHGAVKRTASRPMDTITVDALDSKRPRKTEKGGKGLRHFSMKVCEKVEAKGVTTYNEVAEELVDEFTDPRFSQSEQAQYDQKNIRRRVYDALNVLMAMNIISKEKKEIRWIGLPTNSAQEYQNLELEKANRQARIEQKKQKLQELIVQQIAYKNLVNRNAQSGRVNGPPVENSKIQLPFVIVNTNKKTVIDCSISHDKYEYLFNFDNTFEIHDDIEILKRMGLTYGLEKGQCSSSDLEKAVEMLPKSLEPYIRAFGAPSKTGGDALLASTSEADVASNVLTLTDNF